MVPLFREGNRRDLDLEDLHRPCLTDEPLVVSKHFEKFWDIELKKKNPSVTVAVAKSFGWTYFWVSHLNTINVITVIVNN